MRVLKRKTMVLMILIICFPLKAWASDRGEIFGKGVFNTNWGMTIELVSKQFPNGKAVEYAGITQFEVNDGRTVLNVARKQTNKIRFSFDSEGRLSGVGVHYQPNKFGELLSKLNTLFGQHLNKPNSFGTTAEWSQEDNIKFSLMQISSDVIFTIEYFGLDKPNKSKKELGF